MKALSSRIDLRRTCWVACSLTMRIRMVCEQVEMNDRNANGRAQPNGQGRFARTRRSDDGYAVAKQGEIYGADHIDLDYQMVYISMMHISVSDAKAQLTDLVRRAEAGDEVVLTRHGTPAVRLVAVKPKLTHEQRRQVLEDFRKSIAGKVTPGPDAAHSADFLYGDDGLPE